jgi:hypothetical protein
MATTQAIPAQLRQFALIGARIRFGELLTEKQVLEQTFPELQATRTVPKPANRNRPKKRSMNAAQRKEVSERMTRYWAAWREKRANKQSARRKSQAAKSK